MKRSIILASQSPRRKELMTTLKHPFSSISPSYDEVFDTTLSIEDNIKMFSKNKGAMVLNDNLDAIVISADTVVVLNNEVLLKPKDEQDAYEMLKKLSGKKHEVFTAVTIMTKEHQETSLVKTEVEFYELELCEIEKYIASKEPMDKAGAYAIQGIGSVFIKSITGDYYAVMGLPVGIVYQMLKRYELD